MNICVFDTETTSLEKPFCYNVGYTIYDTDEKAILVSKDRVVEQVWHNPMLFTTAYYSDKRPIYVNRMRSRQTEMNKFGYICQEMIRDFKAYDVHMAFAFNSSFDEKVFNFNCDWFKCNNPFDDVTIKDIRGFAHHFITNDNYKAYCEDKELFTDSGNYSTTAESYYRYLFDDNFTEEHTALSDSKIELEVLLKCVEFGADLESNYEALKSIPRKVKKHWKVRQDRKTVFEFDCYSLTVSRAKNTIMLR